MIILAKFFSLVRLIKTKSYQTYYRKNVGSGGNSVIFYGKDLPIIKGEQNIFLGKNVKINEYSYLFARKNSQIHIGDNSTLSSFCKLITSGYDLQEWLTSDNLSKKDIHIDQDIIIGEHCWIGNNATILAGVKLTGKNVVVASGAIVTKSFSESNIIIGGVPARIIKNL